MKASDGMWGISRITDKYPHESCAVLSNQKASTGILVSGGGMHRRQTPNNSKNHFAKYTVC